MNTVQAHGTDRSTARSSEIERPSGSNDMRPFPTVHRRRASSQEISPPAPAAYTTPSMPPANPSAPSAPPRSDNDDLSLVDDPTGLLKRIQTRHQRRGVRLLNKNARKREGRGGCAQTQRQHLATIYACHVAISPRWKLSLPRGLSLVSRHERRKSGETRDVQRQSPFCASSKTS